MSDVGQLERKTQDRVVKLFQSSSATSTSAIGSTARATRTSRSSCSTQNLEARGYDDNLINKAIDKLKSDASLGGGRDLYEANRDVYDLLRYGVKVKPGVGEQHETVWLIDWTNPEANHFAIAEEVTVLGQPHQAPRRRALRQRHRARRPRAEALHGGRLRGHPPDHRQPEAGVHPPVLHDRPARHGRQRRRGPALRRHRHAGEVLAGLDGGRPTSRTRSTGR